MSNTNERALFSPRCRVPASPCGSDVRQTWEKGARARRCVVFVKLTVDFQHDRCLLCVTVGVRGLAAVDPGVLDDGVVNDEPGS